MRDKIAIQVMEGIQPLIPAEFTGRIQVEFNCYMGGISNMNLEREATVKFKESFKQGKDNGSREHVKK